MVVHLGVVTTVNNATTKHSGDIECSKNDNNQLLSSRWNPCFLWIILSIRAWNDNTSTNNNNFCLMMFQQRKTQNKDNRVHRLLWKLNTTYFSKGVTEYVFRSFFDKNRLYSVFIKVCGLDYLYFASFVVETSSNKNSCCLCLCYRFKRE